MHKLILTTLIYYDLFDFPLTTEEIKKYHSAPGIESDAIDIGLYSLVNSHKIRLIDGFYTLPNREHLIAIRSRTSPIAVRKMKRARLATILMSGVPYIQAVFASGSLALGNTDYNSDLDIFVITKSGRIWTARFITNTIFDLLLLKRKPKDKIAPDKLCLNHYIADNALEIKNQNIFTAHVYAHLEPLYLRNPKVLQEFEKKNEWVANYLDSSSFPHNNLVKNYSLLQFSKKCWEWIFNSRFGDLLESAVRKYQVKRIEQNPLTRDPQGRIEYNDQRLEFHPYSIENSILDKYTKATRLIGKIST